MKTKSLTELSTETKDFTISNLNILGRSETCAVRQDGKLSFHSAPLSIGEVFNGTGHSMSPGLINSHTHVAMSLFRDISHSQSEMIENLFFPIESNIKKEWLAALSYPALVQALKTGTTTIVDHYYSSAFIGKAIDRLGMRGFIGETIADIGGAFPSKETWQKTVDQIEDWSLSSRVSPVVCPHASDTVSKELLSEMALFAKENCLTLHMHLSQTKGEYERTKSVHNMSPVQFASKCGALGPNSLAVHLVSATDSDIQIIKDSGTTVVSCPSSQIIYEKLAPIEKFLSAGISVVIGTDCSASNDSFDMISEAKTFSLLLKDRTGRLSADKVHEILFKNPSIPLQFNSDFHEDCDFVIWKSPIDVQPIANLKSNLIFSHNGYLAQHSSIDGNWVLINGEITKATEKDLMSEFETVFSQAKTSIQTQMRKKIW